MDTIGALDRFLRHRRGVALEQLLFDAAMSASAVPSDLEATCRPLGSTMYEDGGLCDRYEARFVVEGIFYRCRFALFTDAGGLRFVEDVISLDVDRWDVRLVVPRAIEGGSR